MNKITVRTIVISIAVCMWLSLWFVFKPPTEVQAAEAVTVTTFDELVEYCEEGDYVITLGANITVTDVITVEKGNKTIKGNGKKLTGVSGAPVFKIEDGATITSENITIDRTAAPTHFIFYGMPGSNIIINSGV